MKTLNYILAGTLVSASAYAAPPAWKISNTDEWKQAKASSENLKFEDGFAIPQSKTAVFRSVLKASEKKINAKSITFKQSDVWDNWTESPNIGPTNLGDAPVMLSLGPNNYWMFGRYIEGKKQDGHQAKDATLEGFDVPLKTTKFPNQYDAPGGLKKGLGGYHAWQSKDMVNWVHHGPITDKKSRWMTTAEFVDGKAYFYYDFPNDQDPHLYIDDDLTDGMLGKDMGLAFKDPSHGSDCSFIRDLEGKFHVISEDWSPINARTHAWDSPLASHAVSQDGIKDFKILNPPVDHRTKPTGKIGTYKHPHWVKEDPENFKTNVAEYQIHEPEQNAYGDWAAIAIGSQYYLFCDFDPADGHKMSTGRFTSSNINEPFEWCGHVGQGHPDPDVMFAEGRFYLATQQKKDFVSPGPWVDGVEARVGVDTNKDGKADQWTSWQKVKEGYDHTPGFAKVIQRTPAQIDLSELPPGFGFQFEFKIQDTTNNKSIPIIDQVTLSFQ